MEDDASYKKVEQSLTESFKQEQQQQQKEQKEKEEQNFEGVVRLRSRKKKSALVSNNNNKASDSWNPFSSYYSQYIWGRILSWTQPSINHHFSGSEIIDRLWISDHASVCNLTSLQDRKIRYVICCVLGVQPMFPNNLNYLQVPLIDKEEQDIQQFFDAVADYIDKLLKETDWSVIVHCRCGVSRSVTLVCAYLIKYMGTNLGHFTINNPIKNKRKIFPNKKGMSKLKMYFVFLSEYNLEKSMMIRKWALDRSDFSIVCTAPMSKTMYVQSSQKTIIDLQDTFEWITEIKEDGTEEIEIITENG